MSLATAESIDVHAHAVLDATMGAAGAHGPELTEETPPRFRVADYELVGVRYRGSPFMDPELRIAAMDRAGIDYQVLSPNPLTYFHFIDATQAQRFCRVHNDALAKVVERYPGRLGAFAALPMQDIGFAIEEAQRAIGELGFHGVYVGTDFGRPLDDPALEPFYSSLERLDVPLFVHPAPAGIDGPAGDPNLRRFDLDIIVGFAAQEAIAVGTLIYGEVLLRHPKLDVCLSHGGGMTGYAYGRMALAASKRPWASEALQADGAFDALLHRLWFDVHLHSADATDLLATRVNPDHLVYGTNFAGWDQQPYDVRREAAPYAGNTRVLLRA